MGSDTVWKGTENTSQSSPNDFYLLPSSQVRTVVNKLEPSFLGKQFLRRRAASRRWMTKNPSLKNVASLPIDQSCKAVSFGKSSPNTHWVLLFAPEVVHIHSDHWQLKILQYYSVLIVINKETIINNTLTHTRIELISSLILIIIKSHINSFSNLNWPIE